MDIQDIAQVSPLGANAQVVQHHVALGELELGALALGLERLLDGLEVLVPGTLRRQRALTHHVFYIEYIIIL
jgi:hypothetical protein